jgi:hypothetical protein
MTVGQIATETKVTAIIERIALLHVVLVMILSILRPARTSYRWCGHTGATLSPLL